jgi:hemerythrin-like metal-binding protein
MPLLIWNNSFSVGVTSLDQQHTGLFAMVNELNAAMAEGRARKIVGQLLGKLVRYTQEHFAYEERLMEAANYPGLQAHRAQHADLARQVGEFMDRYKHGDSEVAAELLRFLGNWLTTHILHEDKEYGPWIARMARSESTDRNRPIAAAGH